MSYKCAEEWREDPLPEKLSALVRLAVADLVACERDPAYRISMETYHAPLDDLCCWVCLAGAVMAGHLRAAPSREALPSNYPLSIRRKLEALDCFRRGDVVDALSYLDEDTKTLAKVGAYWRIVPYERDIGLFKEQMRALADRLEEAGA